MKLDERFWTERYENGQTGWDAGAITTPIKEYIDQLGEVAKQFSILIPGAGNGYEAEYLLDNGFNDVTVVDISLHPLKRLRKVFPDSAGLNLVHDNFFNLKGRFDLIIEQTFFCALDPGLRTEYARKMLSLMKKESKLVGVLFDAPMNADRPPFGGSIDEYRALFSQYFKINTLEKCYNSIAPRMGSEAFINLTRA